MLFDSLQRRCVKISREKHNTCALNRLSNNVLLQNSKGIIIFSYKNPKLIAANSNSFDIFISFRKEKAKKLHKIN